MKILHANDYFDSVGGAETVLFSSLRVLKEQGIENVVVYQHPRKGSGEEFRTHRVPALGNAWGCDPAALKRFEEILEQEKPDIVHLYDIGNPAVSKAAQKFAPVVQTAFNHSFYCPGGAKYFPWLGRNCELKFGPVCLASAFLTHCNSIRPSVLLGTYERSRRMLKMDLFFIALTEFQAGNLERSGVPRERIRVLMPYTEMPAPQTKKESSGPATLLFSGRVMPTKGLDRLIRALSHVRSPFRLIVSGDGTDLEKSKKLAQQCGLASKIEFLGWIPRDQHLALHQKTSFVVIPSIWPEPFGMTGIEGMSYGCPVIAFAVGGIPEWLEDGKTGFLIKPWDEKAMAEKIEFFLTHPKETAAMGQAGRERVSRDFTKQRFAGELVRIYEEVLHAA